MLNPIFDGIAGLLAWFYELWPSYGMAIVFLTLVVMLLLFPLTAKQVRSMQAMAKLQPEMKRLQAKYKNDRQKLNEEMMKFYKEHKVNPLSSCLPLLLQLPIFAVLYRVLDGLSRQDPNNAGGPKYLDPSTEMWQAIKDAGFKLESFGMDLGRKAVDAHGSFGKALPFYVLVALVVATAYFQQRQINRRNPQAAQANPQMQMIGKIMPAFFGFISLSIPAGVVLYFFVSNLFRIGQQTVIYRTSPDSTPAGRSTAKGDGDKGSTDVVDRDEDSSSSRSGERERPPARPAGRPAPRGDGRPGARPGSKSRKGKGKRKGR